MALKRSLPIVGPECPSECSTVPSPTLTVTMFETLFASDDDVETPPPKTNKSKLEVKCAELDISSVVLTPNKLNSAEDDKENVSCWDTWLEETCFVKVLDAAPHDENMSCMDAWKEDRQAWQSRVAQTRISEHDSSDESIDTQYLRDVDLSGYDSDGWHAHCAF